MARPKTLSSHAGDGWSDLFLPYQEIGAHVLDASGAYGIDAAQILPKPLQLSDGASLGGGARTGGKAPTNFASLQTLSDYLVNGYWNATGDSPHHWQSHTISVNISTLSADEQTLARQALTTWTDVANIAFMFTTGSANITFDNSGTGQAVTPTSYGSDGLTTSATVHISSDWAGGSRDIHSYVFQTYIHEIGHALGLGHLGPYNGGTTNDAYKSTSVFQNDTWQWSVMSYNDQANYGGSTADNVITPMMADIAAIQSIYGYAQTRTGNTTYGFHSNAGAFYDFANYATAPALTIYDLGGINTLNVSGYANNQTIDLHVGMFSSVGGLTNNIALYTSMQNAVGGTGNDHIVGNDEKNQISGNSGVDTIFGFGNDDQLFGNDGDDAVWGGSGNDYMEAGSGNDLLAGEDGNDTVYGEQGNDQLVGGYGADKAYGGDDNDTLVGSDGNDILLGENGDDTLEGGIDTNTLNGGAGNDMLIVGDGSDYLDGGDGFDTMVFRKATVADWQSGVLDATVANDVWANWEAIQGSSGADTIRTNSWGYSIALYGGDGNDILATGVDGDVNDTINGQAGDDSIAGGNGADGLYGASGNDVIHGDAGNDHMNGGSGNDTMYGGLGNDTYVVNAIGDVVSETGGDGTDLVISSVTWRLGAGQEDLELTGSSRINGQGNAGDNVITGNVAHNVLDGGSGRDTFVFATLLSTAKPTADTINDFSHKDDTIDLDRTVFSGMKAGTLSSSSFQLLSSGTSSKGLDLNDFILYDKSDGDLYFDRDGSKGRYDRVLFAHVVDGTAMSNTDFHIV
jgi:serralysin